jgi:hypothetical protein
MDDVRRACPDALVLCLSQPEAILVDVRRVRRDFLVKVCRHGELAQLERLANALARLGVRARARETDDARDLRRGQEAGEDVRAERAGGARENLCTRKLLSEHAMTKGVGIGTYGGGGQSGHVRRLARARFEARGVLVDEREHCAVLGLVGLLCRRAFRDGEEVGRESAPNTASATSLTQRSL